MAKQKKSYKGSKQYATYKSENRARKNKIMKLKRHLKAFPDDQKASGALINLEKNQDFIGRKAPKRLMGRINPMLPVIPEGAPGAGRVDYKRLTPVKTDDGTAVYIQVRESLNLANGRLSAFGRSVQQLKRMVKSFDNEMSYDKHKKLMPKLETWKLGPCFASDSDEEFFETNFSSSKTVKRKSRKKKK